MSTHEAAGAAPAKPRRSGAIRILAQAGFILLACLGCTIVLISMMEGSLSTSYVDSLKGQLRQYAASSAEILPAAAIQQGDPDAQAYLDSFLASLFSAAAADPQVEYGYAVFRLEGDIVQVLSLSSNVGGPSGSAEQYLEVAASSETLLWEDGRRLSALTAVCDEEGQAVGIVEIIGDWSKYQKTGSALRRQLLLACGIGVVCMMVVYIFMALVSAVRERNAKGDAQ